MSIFTAIKDLFCYRLDPQPSLATLVEYLPVGDLLNLEEWVKTNIRYVADAKDWQEYQGADLAIREGSGDCEEKAAVKVEVGNSEKWAREGWEFHHIRMVFTRDGGKTHEGHDIAHFANEREGREGWMDAGVYDGTYEDMYAAYKADGWDIQDWWMVNDMGVRT